jgi:hypothetical protein
MLLLCYCVTLLYYIEFYVIVLLCYIISCDTLCHIVLHCVALLWYYVVLRRGVALLCYIVALRHNVTPQCDTTMWHHNVTQRNTTTM